MIFGKDRRRMANLITENEKLKQENKNLVIINQELENKLAKKANTTNKPKTIKKEKK